MNSRPLAVLCSHEDIAVAMGHGYANAMGRSSLVILHDLVGLMHGVMGVYDAWCARAPFVVLPHTGHLSMLGDPAGVAHAINDAAS